MEKKNKVSVDKINYCFYMPVDFNDKFEKIQAADDRLKSLSKSQALNLIISEMAAKIPDPVQE